MEKALTLFLKFLPLVFAFGFLVPVIAQGLQILGWVPPFRLSALSFALVVGGTWGLIAQWTGRWI